MTKKVTFPAASVMYHRMFEGKETKSRQKLSTLGKILVRQNVYMKQRDSLSMLTFVSHLIQLTCDYDAK